MSNRDCLIELKDNYELGKIDIAYEVYLVEEFLEFTFKENWEFDYSSREDLPTKKSLEHWITNKGEKGAVTIYFEQNSAHFSNADWQARHSLEALKFICRKLVDENFMNKERLKEYEYGFKTSEVWIESVIGHIFNLLLRELGKGNYLKSRYANKKVQEVIEGKNIRNEIYSILAKVEDEDIKEDYKKETEKLIKLRLNQPNLKADYPEEFKLFRAIQPKIKRLIEEERNYLISEQMSFVRGLEAEDSLIEV